MALEIGDRGIVDAAPVDAFDSDEPWTCGRCGRAFPRSATWVVKYLHDDGDPFNFVVCPRCGPELNPMSVVIDLDRLDELRDEAGLSELESLVSLVEELREKTDRERLALRWMDLAVVASAKQLSIPELVDYLEELGIVTDRCEGRDRR